MTYSFKTKGVCTSNITFDLENGIVSNVCFRGGCNGNLKAISKLVEGMDANKVVEILRGNICGFKGTSCADQLAIAIEQAMNSNKDEN